MKKVSFLFCLLLMISGSVWSQTAAHRFECHLSSAQQAFTQSQIENYIAKANLESFRLKDKRVTLSFDNGFDIVLLSATELEHAGLMSATASYPTDYSPSFKLPSFHLSPSGIVCTAYTSGNSKYSTKEAK